MRKLSRLTAVTLVALLVSSGSVDAWTSTSPDPISVVAIGGTARDGGGDVAVDGDGNIYVTGTFRGTVDFDPGPGTTALTAPIDDSIFVTKFDPKGDLVWVQIFGNSEYEQLSIEINQSREIFIAGSFSNSADFDPGSGVATLSPTGGASRDGFIVKLQPSGSLIWAKSFGGASNDEVHALAIDATSNVFVVGRFIGTADFDPGPGTSDLTVSADEAYLLKLDSTGAFGWVKQFGGSFADSALGVATDTAGNIYVSGAYSVSGDFDPGTAVFNLTAVGGQDAYLVKLSPSGTFEWAKSFGGSGSETATAVATDSSGNVLISGTFNGTGNYDPNGSQTLTFAGGFDTFILKLNSAGVLTWAKSIGGSGWDEIWGLASDADGNAFITGTFDGSADFDPGPGTSTLSATGGGVYVLKLAGSTGAYGWARAIGGASWDAGLGIAVDGNGNSYSTGYFNGSSDFDPGSGVATLSSTGSDDAFVIRLDPAGSASIDVVAPGASWTSPSTPSTSRTVSFTATFTEAVSGIESSDFVNTGTATGCIFTPSAAATTTSVTVSVTCTSDGTVIPQLNANSIRDLSFNTGPTSAAVASAVSIATSTPTTTPPTTTTASSTASTTTSAPPTSSTVAAAEATKSARATKSRALPATGSPATGLMLAALCLVAAGVVALRRKSANRFGRAGGI